MRKLLPALLLVTACGDDGGAAPDARAFDADPDAVDAADTSDAPPAVCGDAAAPASQITGTEGIAIAPDGTIYYSQTGHVGRWVPGDAAPTDDWVALAGTSTVWGMGLAADGTLYVATPAGNATAGVIWAVDTGAASAEMLYPMAGRPNGLTIGPDDAIYYGDFAGGHVYRLDSSGNRTTVTATPFDAPNGVLFDADGTLLVAEYARGEIWRVTVDAARTETGRAMLTGDAGNPDGLARDAAGRTYVTDNGGGALLVFDAAWGAPDTVLPDVPAAANLAFGRGALPCTALHVTSAGALQVVTVPETGVP